MLWDGDGSLRRPCIACIDFRSLSLNSPSIYCVAAARCGWRLKHALNPSRNRPNRRSSARAGPVVTRAAYRTYGKVQVLGSPTRTANQPDKVVSIAPVCALLLLVRRCLER